MTNYNESLNYTIAALNMEELTFHNLVTQQQSYLVRLAYIQK